jgi:UDP-hydrolysing UDP-N-acetyl-D-glucosamine 2-epimerase
VFVLGDRWEMLAVASAAAMLQVPIVHHSGGDITQGSADNQTRYALTTLSHLHLVALPEHRDRLLRMGEEAWRVTTTGEPALTMLSDYAVAVPDLHARLGLAAGEPFVLATFHPTSFDAAPPEQQVDAFLAALAAVHGAIVLTAPNPDAASELFLRKYRAYAASRPQVRLHESLGAETYYAAMARARFMLGNSSSGLWEAPSFRLPVVNLGPRQQGRVHGANVVHSSLAPGEVAAAIARVTAPAFRAALDGANPYVRADTLALIVAGLKHGRERAALLAKRFIDPLALR